MTNAYPRQRKEEARLSVATSAMNGQDTSKRRLGPFSENQNSTKLRGFVDV